MAVCMPPVFFFDRFARQGRSDFCSDIFFVGGRLIRLGGPVHPPRRDTLADSAAMDLGLGSSLTFRGLYVKKIYRFYSIRNCAALSAAAVITLMMPHVIEAGGIRIGGGEHFVLIAGPCVIESLESAMATAAFLKDVTDELEIPFIFKTSYDKANRTSLSSYRGPGLSKGLDIIASIKDKVGLHVLSDVHRFSEIAPAAQVLDVLQIPAFLCRQTDFIVAVSEAGKPVNIKKGQFLAPWDVESVVEKVVSTGNRQVILTERGTTFGYNNLVVDLRSLAIMRGMGWPVVFDATHSVQLPGGAAKASGGQREFVPMMARAAVAAGVDGIFLETYEDPDRALCDGPNSLALREIRRLLEQLKAIQGVLSAP